MKIVIVGGDKRMRYAANELKKDFDTDTLALFDGDSGDMKSADVLLLPVPATRDKTNVNATLSDKTVPLKEVEKQGKNALVLTCGYEFNLKHQIDYGKQDGFCIKNAVPTAEGAIANAILSTEKTLFDSKVLITGFGRIGKVLTARISPLCRELFVSARSEKDLAFIKAAGINAVKTSRVKDIAPRFDIIFNTLDINLLDSDVSFKDTVLFDLSSKGCTSEEISGLNVIKLPGIPGKTAAYSAGKIIAETTAEIIRRELS